MVISRCPGEEELTDAKEEFDDMSDDDLEQSRVGERLPSSHETRDYWCTIDVIHDANLCGRFLRCRRNEHSDRRRLENRPRLADPP